MGLSSLRLISSFALLLAFIYLLKSPLAQPFVEALCLLLAKLAASLIHLFISDLVLDKDTFYVGTVEYGIKVAPECAALLGCTAIASLIAVEKVSVVEKMKALIVGFAIIQLMNVVRLCLLFFARIWLLPPTYDAIHELYFQIAMIVLTLCFYMAWRIKRVPPNTQNNAISNDKNEVVKFGIVSATLIFVYTFTLQSQFKYFVYLPTATFVTVSDGNWGSDVSISENQNRLEVSNHLFAARQPVAEQGEKRSVALNQTTSMDLVLNKNNFVLPLLLALVVMYRRYSSKMLVCIVAIAIILQSANLTLLYHHQIASAMQGISFPAAVTNDNWIEPVEKYSVEFTLFLKHLNAALILFFSYTFCAYCWQNFRTVEGLKTEINNMKVV
ncbi:hypothetical protein D210916BOD24_31200 [Alteromonas sp. D210916BOD_24]|uniref:exosortase/archaeosortase family protein n=1 Tax=Alteromonas sp. D210916BOD_24 TaxID=3157618 RepID=UPI00399CF424